MSFRVNEPTYTSSLRDLEQITLERFPEIVPGELITLTTSRLSDLLEERHLKPQSVVVDVQGAAQDVLDGLGELWDDVQILVVEYESTPLYTGSPTRDDRRGQGRASEGSDPSMSVKPGSGSRGS